MESRKQLRICERFTTSRKGKTEVVWFNSGDISDYLLKVTSPDPDLCYIPHFHSSVADPVRFSTVDYLGAPPSPVTYVHSGADFSSGCSTASIGSTVYAVGPEIGDDVDSGSHPGIRFVELSPSLVRPRQSPKLLVVGGRLFVIAGNGAGTVAADGDQRPSKSAKRGPPPFIEVFNPSDSACSSELKQPPFSGCRFPRRLGFWVVAPLLGDAGEEKILVMSQMPPADFGDIMHTYDVVADKWEAFEDTDDVLYHHLSDIHGEPVAVAEKNGVYWLSSRTPGNIGKLCYYNWKTKQLSQASIVGLHFDKLFLNFDSSTKVLLHLRAGLFCLVWYEFSANSTELHLTILKLSKTHSLTARVVGCLRYLLPGTLQLRGAYLLHEPAATGKQEWQPV